MKCEKCGRGFERTEPIVREVNGDLYHEECVPEEIKNRTWKW